MRNCVGAQLPLLPPSVSIQSVTTHLSSEAACSVTLIVDDLLRVVNLVTSGIVLAPDFLASLLGSEYVHLYWAILCQLAPRGTDWGDAEGAIAEPRPMNGHSMNSACTVSLRTELTAFNVQEQPRLTLKVKTQPSSLAIQVLGRLMRLAS
mmetsp:Transcript_38776/g.77616  ORF Transcript_38776/g.77616 Transcript_38776/m.77616 type:complete len:150 (-) Transcript_38776:435-884(-)